MLVARLAREAIDGVPRRGDENVGVERGQAGQAADGGDGLLRRAVVEVEGADVEEVGVGAREGAEEVRGEEVGECFPGGEEEGGRLYGVRAAARRQYACPGSSTTSL